MNPLQALPGEMIARASSHGDPSLLDTPRPLYKCPDGAG